MMSQLPIFNLEDYGISPRLGFLPHQSPLTQLPDLYYQIWEDVISRIQEHDYGTIRWWIDELPLLSTGMLRSEPEWRRAYTILTTFAQIYIWTEGKPSNV